MSNGLPTVERLISLFSRFPGIGSKSAQRMVFHLLKRGREESGQLMEALRLFHERVVRCPVCHNLAEGSLCDICRDPGRDGGLLCLVEEPWDLFAIEKAGIFKGLYHVLGGTLNPLEGVGPEELQFPALEVRLASGGFREMILATNPTVEGEATAHFAARLAMPHVGKVTRLAYGLPMGGNLEYVDESTLFQALQGRRDY